MPQLIRVNSEKGELLIAVRTPDDRLAAAGAVTDKVLETVDTTLDSVFQTARLVSDSFSRVIAGQQLKGAELEFGLNFSMKGNIYLVESAAEASIKVKFTY